uniref:Uncharacterized protein n=1 Tax=Neogobius melanostomus TaxID=47308 RepID=A0A8C6WM02_9GOBI
MCSKCQEIFVGLSKRTNQRGAEILADTFKGKTHAKTNFENQIRQWTKYRYHTLTVLDDFGANCHVLLHMTGDQFPESFKVTFVQTTITLSQDKVDGALTCISILINKKTDI